MRIGQTLSRLVTMIAEGKGWCFVYAAYCRAETLKNPGKFPIHAAAHWDDLQVSTPRDFLVHACCV
jgi:hypothetical protein